MIFDEHFIYTIQSSASIFLYHVYGDTCNIFMLYSSCMSVPQKRSGLFKDDVHIHNIK